MSSVTQKGGILYEMIDLHNGKGYAGKDSNPKLVGGVWIAQRPLRHFSAAMRGKDDSPLLNRAIRRNNRLYGKPMFLVIHHPDWHPNADALNTGEQELIRVREYFADRSKGYNLTDGGEGAVGRVVLEETRSKTSASLKGHSVSDETRAKIGNASRGRKHSPEHRAKISAALRGKKRRPYSQEARANMSAAHLGKKHTPEHRAKISAALRGRPKHQGHGAKVSASKGKYRDAHIDDAMAMISAGESQSSVARAMGVSRPTISNWIERYNARLAKSR